MQSACPKSIWSRGVELARAEGVSRESGTRDEVVLRVVAPGRVVTPRVVLYPGDEEWECDCGERADPCAHVAAGVIALRRAEREGRSLASGAASGGPVQLGYRFERTADGLRFHRVTVEGDTESPFTTTLAAVMSGRAPGPLIAADKGDFEIERTLGGQRQGRIARGVLHRLLGLLESAADVRLDGEPIHTSREPVGFRARLMDAGEGWRLELERDPRPTEKLGDDLVLCGDVLRRLGRSGLDGRELDQLRGGRRFGPEDASHLVSEVLPSLRDRFPVEVATDRLPDSERTPPALRVEVGRAGDRLSVLATLVYGDPLRARVDAGRLVPISGAVPVRDRPAEERLIASLRHDLSLSPGQRVELEAEDAIPFASRLASFRGRIVGDAHHDFREASALVPEFSVTDAGFDLSFRCPTRSADAGAGLVSQEARGEASAAAVLRAWRDGRSRVALLGGGFAPLPADWLSRHGRVLLDLLAARDESTGSVPTVLLPDLAQLCADLDTPPPARLETLRPLLEGFDGLPAAELPADLQGELRHYQEEGVAWLGFLEKTGLGGLLADDMGLGKTLQALCALRAPALVVCPTSVLPNWVLEAQKFRPGLRRCLFHGAGRSLDREADVVFTSYALLRLDRVLAEREWHTVVLDEAQAIKNPASQTARAAFGLRAKFRIALTGTPVENRLAELWSQIHFTNPGLLGGRSDFDTRYERPIASGDAEVATRLRARLRPFVLRRRKREVAPELPERQEIVLRCELGEDQRAVYDAVRAATLPDVVAQLREGGGVMAALEALLRLRQACCHASLLPGREAESSAKLDLLVERLENAVADSHKALVFSQWTSFLDLVEAPLRERGLEFTRLDGSTRDRGGVVADFSREDGPPILLLSLRAGGTGLNLTEADHVFLLEPWWNPAVEDQAADRTHRIGQTRPVLVQRLIARNTVEERILVLQESKRALAEAALDGGGAAAGLTRDDLLAVLEG